MMKKVLSLGMVLIMLLTVVGCVSENNNELTEYKEAAKAELMTYVEALDEGDYKEEDWAEVLAFVAEGKAGIESATSKTAVDEAVSAAKGKIDGVEKEMKMTEELARRVKQDFIDNILKVEYKDHLEEQHPDAKIITDDISFFDYLGFYNGSVVVVFRTKYFPPFIRIVWDNKVEDLDFSYSDGYPIRVWNNGIIGMLSTWYYEQGILTKEDLEVIHYLYQNQSKQEKW